jgi:hypothetical protein
MIVQNGAQNITTYFVLRDIQEHLPKTDIDVTTIDLYYVKTLAAISAKVDCAALPLASSPWAANSGFNVGKGIYRIDWPDDAFAGSAGDKVQLIVHCLGIDTTYLEVLLSSVGGDISALQTDCASIDDNIDAMQSDIGAIRAKTDTLGGAGAITFTYTLTDATTGQPITDADVWVTSDLAGNFVLASGKTDQVGVVEFMLEAGTVYIWRQKTGYNFTNPDQETVA